MNSIELEKLKAALETKQQFFMYYKKDGSIRWAMGTRNINEIPTEQHPKGKRKEYPSIIAYYDLRKGEWRSFIKENLFAWDNRNAVTKQLKLSL